VRHIYASFGRQDVPIRTQDFSTMRTGPFSILHFLKLLLISAGTLALIFIIGASLVMYFAFKPSSDEVARVESPDLAVVATLIESNGGATTSFGYEVRLSENHTGFGDKRVAYLYGAIRSATAYGVNLRWTSASELSIEYLKALSADLEEREARIGPRTIHITLKPGVVDETAPTGGMLYNLERH
jgi:hypothetical protein